MGDAGCQTEINAQSECFIMNEHEMLMAIVNAALSKLDRHLQQRAETIQASIAEYSHREKDFEYFTKAVEYAECDDKEDFNCVEVDVDEYAQCDAELKPIKAP